MAHELIDTNASIQVPIFIYDKEPDLLIHPFASIISSKGGEIGTVSIVQTGMGGVLFHNAKEGWFAIISPERIFQLINDRIAQNGIPT